MHLFTQMSNFGNDEAVSTMDIQGCVTSKLQTCWHRSTHGVKPKSPACEQTVDNLSVLYCAGAALLTVCPVLYNAALSALPAR